MSCNNRIAIVGHFGGKENFLDGQTVKTKILYQEMTDATHQKIRKVDTYYKSKNPAKLLTQLFLSVLFDKHFIILLSRNGMKIFFPFFSLLAKVFGKRIYHDVIGGNLDRYVSEHPAYRKYLNSFEVNWVETQGLKEKLETLGIENCDVLPNFKRLDCVSEDTLHDAHSPFRFCTFSRVTAEKGIGDAIKAVSAINEKAEKNLCELTVFGAIDPNFQEELDLLLKNASPESCYGGLVPFDKSVETIKDFDALLFPSRWNGEGFPGTIVDAFSAGLPVIASDWNCNSELVDHEKTGLLYSLSEEKGLENAILNLLEAPNFVEMKKNCLKKAALYQPEIHVKTILGKIFDEKN